MRKPILFLTALLFFSNYLSAQNSMVGDGFGGRGWYKPHNYQVGAYSAYTVCGDSDQLYGWGGNNHGELGNGTYISSDTPIATIGMSNVKFYTTGYVSAAIKRDSSAWVWSTSRAIYSGYSNSPTMVLEDVKFIDGGLNQVAFIKYDGTAWAAGSYNQSGALGNGTDHSTLPVIVPVQMTGITNGVRVASLGDDGLFNYNAAIIILLDDGTVKITGGSNWFQSVGTNIPVSLAGLNDIVDIKGNAVAGYALSRNGSVYSFGKDTPEFPALGLGRSPGIITPPSLIVFPAGAAPIVALSANNDGYSCLALDSNHNVYGWGGNSYGQLGTGNNVVQPTPVLLATNVMDIFAGENFSYLLKTDGTLWATGRSGYPNIQYWGSIWMNLPNIQRNVFTQIDPTIPPMNLCAPKVWGVVPVKLSNFTCVANGNNAVLNWQSAEEINASKYIVQYSNDGRRFKDIATEFATGSNSKYNYTHQQVSGTAFYRLKMIDKDGRFTYSEIRVVKFDNKAGFTIAPNPANDVAYVFTKNSNAIKSIQIISVDGQVVKTLNGYNNGQEIGICNLARGTYILKAVYKNGEMEYGRFIKM